MLRSFVNYVRRRKMIISKRTRPWSKETYIFWMNVFFYIVIYIRSNVYMNQIFSQDFHQHVCIIYHSIVRVAWWFIKISCFPSSNIRLIAAQKTNWIILVDLITLNLITKKFTETYKKAEDDASSCTWEQCVPEIQVMELCSIYEH